ncbi:MAG: transposase family protein [Chloroflexi bacterium]|nr:transposase family protein [Chloroflexota bacterium]
MMSQKSKQELAEALRPRYQQAGRAEKCRMLDEFVAATGYHRKYASHLLKHWPRRRTRQRRRSTAKYQVVVGALEQLWQVADQICGKRLVAALPALVTALERHGELRLDQPTRELLLQISPATADRLLRPLRRRLGHRQGLSTTKPGTLLKQAIRVRTFADWDDARPGFTEIDLVAHGGDSAQGEFVHSLDIVDITTRWSEQVALPNRSQAAVTAALDTARQRLPFPLLGVDSDNGGEFINANLLRYCEQHQLTFTRSRPYRKNDQAHVEQKNWTAVRQIVGYDRYEGQPACDALNALYTTRHLYHNFFQPVMVLVSKKRDGAKVTKRYDAPQTPYQRVLAAPDVTEADKARLRQLYATLNPAALLRQIRTQQAAVWKLALKAETG